MALNVSEDDRKLPYLVMETRYYTNVRILKSELFQEIPNVNGQFHSGITNVHALLYW